MIFKTMISEFDFAFLIGGIIIVMILGGCATSLKGMTPSEVGQMVQFSYAHENNYLDCSENAIIASMILENKGYDTQIPICRLPNGSLHNYVKYSKGFDEGEILNLDGCIDTGRITKF